MKIKKNKKLFNKYQTIKIPLDKIISDPISKDKILDCVQRTNRIIIKTYQSLKYWILNKYHSNLEIPLITENVIGMAQKSVLKPSRGPKAKNNNLIILNEFKDLNLFNNLTLEDGTNLSGILDYHKTSILTSIENNIKCHYFDHLNSFINCYFKNKYKEEIKGNDFKKQLIKDLKKVKNDIINGSNTSKSKYSKWILENKEFLIPNDIHKEGHYYEIVVNPQKYLKPMIWMNLQIERMGCKMLNFIPLRTDVIPKNIPIDTKSLIDFLVPRDKNKYLKDIMGYKDNLWNKYFDINIKVKNYSFDHTILTNGYSCSIRFINNSLIEQVNEKKIRIKEGRKGRIDKNTDDNGTAKVIPINSNLNDFKEEVTEFPYIDEVDRKELIGRHIYIDPGKRDLLSIIDDMGNRMTFSNRQRLKETKRLKYGRIIKNLKDKLGITKIENVLTQYNSKTCELLKFKEYIEEKNKINNLLLPLYENLGFRKYKWYSYINEKRSNDKLVNRIENKFGKDIIIIHGDWSIRKQMRNFISTPNLNIKRKLGSKFRVYNIDEYRTSQLHHITEEKCGNLYLRDNKGQYRKLHSVLTYQMKRKGCINRDYNACLNIKKIFENYLNGKERPQKYQRNKVTKNTNPSFGVKTENDVSNGILLEDHKNDLESAFVVGKKKSVIIRKK